MIGFISKKILFGLSKSQIPDVESQGQEVVSPCISTSLTDNIDHIKAVTGNSSDIKIRMFSIGQNSSISAALIFVDGLIDPKIMNCNIIEPMMEQSNIVSPQNFKDISINEIATKALTAGDVKEAKQLDKIIEGFLSGNAVVLIDGFDSCLIVNCKGWDKRNVDVPSSESVIRGPRESFTENIITNTAMIRRKIKSPDLTIEATQIGIKTKTCICLVYIKDLANKELIQTVKDRLSQIHTDSILDSGYIEQYIEDSSFSVFSTIGNTEKPDVAAAKLLEGRVAIVVDGTPNVLTAPMLFIESFQTAEDYYWRPYFASMLRIVRYLAYFSTVLVPAIYVGVTTYNQELLPTNLLFTMRAARATTPFPAVVEALVMLVAFEILREAGVRLPQPVGQAMSIVGALVMGEAAVSAGIVSAPMVIVVAITAVATFAVPHQSDSAAILRLIFLILAGTMGGYGIMIGVLGTLVHLASLKSFSFPFLSPIAPFEEEDVKDTFFRFPLWLNLSRPKGMAKGNIKRSDFMIPPAHPSDHNSETDL